MGASAEKVVRQKWCLLQATMDERARRLRSGTEAGAIRRRYPTGKKISKKELRELKVEREEFHGEWNYVIRSRMEQR